MSDQSLTLASAEVRERSILRNVYLWMTAGLAITGITAWGVSGNENILLFIFSNQFVFWGIIIAQLVLVFVISSRIMKMSIAAATICFGVYAVLMGLSLSSIFILYELGSIAFTFFIAAGTFAAMSVWAVATKRDLSGMGSFLMMGLFGLIIASVVNIFLRSSGLEWIISLAGVALFVGLTAYDTQMIKKWNEEAGNKADDNIFVRLSILGALKLYLDFINMFMFILRLVGRRR